MSDLPGYLLYRGLSGTFGLLPEPAMRSVGRALGMAAYPVGGRRAEIARRNMRRVLGPETPDDVIEAAAREVFASYGRYYAELFWYRPRRWDAVLERTRVDDLGPVYAARDRGKGVVFALPHVGNFDAPGVIAHELDLPLMAVAERLPNRRITDWFVQVRRSLGIEIVFAGDGRKTTSRLIGHLRSGGAVALLADRSVTGNGVEVEFFGERTVLPAGPVALADRTGATLLTVGPFFADGPGADIVVRDTFEMPIEGDRAARIAEGTQRLAHELEELISTHPTQWHVVQPNWPSDPGWSGPGSERSEP